MVAELNPPLKTNGCDAGFGGVDCGVNEKPLLFENGFALFTVVGGKSTFGGLVAGNARVAFANGFADACSS